MKNRFYMGLLTVFFAAVIIFALAFVQGATYPRPFADSARSDIAIVVGERATQSDYQSAQAVMEMFANFSNNITVVSDDEMNGVDVSNYRVIREGCVNSLSAELFDMECPSCGGEFLIRLATDNENDEVNYVIVSGYDDRDTRNGFEYLVNNNINFERN